MIEGIEKDGKSNGCRIRYMKEWVSLLSFLLLSFLHTNSNRKRGEDEVHRSRMC